jgi:hypothetical protein
MGRHPQSEALERLKNRAGNVDAQDPVAAARRRVREAAAGLDLPNIVKQRPFLATGAVLAAGCALGYSPKTCQFILRQVLAVTKQTRAFMDAVKGQRQAR